MMELVLTMLLVLPPAEAVRVPSRVTVDGPKVLLADLGWPDKILGQVALFDSPAPGRTITIKRRTLLRILRREAPGIRFVVPRALHVRRSARKVDGAELGDLVRRALATTLPRGAKIVSLYLGRRSITLPRGKISVSLAQTSSLPRPGAWVGRATVSASGWSVTFGISVRYTLVRPVAVLRHARRAGEAITSQDVEFREMDITRIPEAMTRDRFRDGMVARTSLRAGIPLTMRLVRKPRVIRRGQRVRMIARIGAVEVSTWGIARRDGAEGDTIVLTNPRTGKVIRGVVVGPGRVLVVRR